MLLVAHDMSMYDRLVPRSNVGVSPVFTALRSNPAAHSMRYSPRPSMTGDPHIGDFELKSPTATASRFTVLISCASASVDSFNSYSREMLGEK
ncbi:hypothetical protein QE152_g37152 [Popillia japonica]|uniref:Uncharacterized protein n=1 Tax=Popillia japonica TaxID=7064 RepID=A0AAW1IB06_POPJA